MTDRCSRWPARQAAWGASPYDNMPALLHKDETVLPADLAEAYRQGAGGDIHVHIHAVAVDGPSVRKLLNSYEFRRELRDAGRRRVL
jgi:hypothetical protein